MSGDKQSFEIIPNDWGIVQVRFKGADGQYEVIQMEDLPLGKPLEVEVVAGTPNPFGFSLKEGEYDS